MATSVELVRGALGAMWKEHVPHTLSLLLPEPPPQPQLNAPSPADHTQDGGGGLPGQDPRVACRRGGALGEPGE